MSTPDKALIHLNTKAAALAAAVSVGTVAGVPMSASCLLA